MEDPLSPLPPRMGSHSLFPSSPNLLLQYRHPIQPPSQRPHSIHRRPRPRKRQTDRGSPGRDRPLLGALAGAGFRVPTVALPEVRRVDADHRLRSGPGCDRAHAGSHRRADRAAGDPACSMASSGGAGYFPGRCRRICGLRWTRRRICGMIHGSEVRSGRRGRLPGTGRSVHGCVWIRQKPGLGDGCKGLLRCRFWTWGAGSGRINTIVLGFRGRGRLEFLSC